MSDQALNAESGGGEGSIPSAAPVTKESEPVKAEEFKPEEVKPESVKPEQVKQEEVKPEAVKSEKIKPEAVKPEEVKSDAEAVKPEEVKSEAVKTEETQSQETEDKTKPVELKVEAKSQEHIETQPETQPDVTKQVIAEETLKEEATAGPSAPQQNGDQLPEWQQRELELLKRIEELETFKNATAEEGLKYELKIRDQEIDLLKARVKNLETELQAALSKPSGKNHEMIQNIKQQHEELLSKARGMIFDKSKMVQNQELQIAALGNQVASLKDINQITKDLLEVRNGEVKAMEDRLQVMEAKFKVEKERFSLVLQRAQNSSSINDDLKREYETQLAIFKELRQKYEQRVQALVTENTRLKELAEARAQAQAQAQHASGAPGPQPGAPGPQA